MMRCKIIAAFKGRDGRLHSEKEGFYEAEDNECERLLAAQCLQLLPPLKPASPPSALIQSDDVLEAPEIKTNHTPLPPPEESTGRRRGRPRKFLQE